MTPGRREELRELRDELAESLVALDKLLEQPDDDEDADAEKKAPLIRSSRAIDYQLAPKREVAFKSGDALLQKANEVLDSVNELAAKMRRERFRY